MAPIHGKKGTHCLGTGRCTLHMAKPLYVTQPLLPPLDEFTPYLRQIWDNKQLTNAGPMHQQLEAALCEYLGVEHLALFANGTLALLTALRALGIRDEVITTPYSFVATANALLWAGCDPVFVDVEADSLNLDPARVEAAITARTTAILAVHCYGQPCQVAELGELAARRGLRLIYDGAHAFGVRDGGGSVLRHPDISMVSFHATKVFNTFEGGALICADAATKQRIDRLRNFGFDDEVSVSDAGINAKLNEVSAAFGLLQLAHLDESLRRRKHIDAHYRAGLASVRGIRCLQRPASVQANYCHFPIFVGAQYPLTRDELCERLRVANIFARRYFYPLISDFLPYRSMRGSEPGNLPVAERAAREVLCLPLHSALDEQDVERVLDVIRKGDA
jgi:dTDP-4-amino-4,6-dideoxygalactose transaminase